MSNGEIDPFEFGGTYTKRAELNEDGDTVQGVIVSAKMEQDRKWDENNPGKGPLLYWMTTGKGVTETPNDSPVMYPVFVLQAFEPNDDDDGLRAVHMNKPRLKDSIKSATLKAGAQKMSLGGWLKVTMPGFVKGKGSNRAKSWESEYRTATWIAENGVPEGTAKPTPKDDDPFA